MVYSFVTLPAYFPIPVKVMVKVPALTVSPLVVMV